MKEKQVKEMAEIIEDIKDMNKQLNAQKPDISELQKIDIKAKKEFINETPLYETSQSLKPDTSFIPITQVSVDDHMQRLPL